MVGLLVQVAYMLPLGKFGPMGLKGFTSGVVADSFESPIMLFAENGRLVADGKAVAMTLSLKGNAGLLPCHLCANVLMKGALSDPAHALDNPGNEHVEITHPTLDGCIAHTNESILKNADELHQLHTLWKQKKLTKGNFELAEKAIGLNYNPQGWLWDLQLRTFVDQLTLF